MTTGIVETEAYKDTDGRFHETYQNALVAQRKINLREWAEYVRLCCGGEWSQEMVLDTILDNSETLKSILSSC